MGLGEGKLKAPIGLIKQLGCITRIGIRGLDEQGVKQFVIKGDRDSEFLCTAGTNAECNGQGEQNGEQEFSHFY